MNDPKLTEQLAAEAAETAAVLNETEQPEPAKIPTYFKPNRHDRRKAAAKRRRKKDKK